MASDHPGLLIKCWAALEVARCELAVTFVFVSLHLFFPAGEARGPVFCALETTFGSHRQVYRILTLDGIRPTGSRERSGMQADQIKSLQGEKNQEKCF